MAFDDIAGDLGRVARTEALGHAQPLACCRHVVDVVSSHSESRLLQMLDPLFTASTIGTFIDVDRICRAGRQVYRCAKGKQRQQNSYRLCHGNHSSFN